MKKAMISVLMFGFMISSLVTVSFLAQAQQNEIQQIAQNLAEELWPDTILEGDFATDFKVSIDKIETLQNGVLRITYSAKAWATDTCDYSPDDLTTLSDCQSGRIIESAFISSDLTQVERDEQAFAEFVPTN